MSVVNGLLSLLQQLCQFLPFLLTIGALLTNFRGILRF